VYVIVTLVMLWQFQIKYLITACRDSLTVRTINELLTGRCYYFESLNLHSSHHY